MSPSESDARLSRISTQWNLVAQAHREQGDVRCEAQRLLLQRYCGAVYHYFLTAVRDADAAEELSQEFALRFVRGDFRRASEERGRFRDFVRTSLRHLIVDLHRHQRRLPRQMVDDSGLAPAVPPDTDAADRQFVHHWREALLNRVWEALAGHEKETGQLFHTVLLWRVHNPRTPAVELAELLTNRLGRPFTEVGVRQTLHRAREKFADLLLDEVAQSLETTEPERLEAELIDLEVEAYCRPALDRRRR